MASVKTISPERDREKEQTAFQQLVRKAKYKPDVVLDRNAATFKKRRAVAPFANSGHGGCHEWFRTTHRLDALDVPSALITARNRTVPSIPCSLASTG